MAENHTYEDHVWMLKNMPSGPSATWDVTIGISCLVATLLGFVGNSLAFGYFHGKKELAPRLYKYLSCIDIVICLCQIPVIQAFLNGRNPGLFNDKIFCNFWTVVSDISTKFYPMAVLLLSASRTIAIACPFYGIRKNAVIAVLYIYLFYLGLRQVGNFLVGFGVIYGADSGYCYSFFDTQTGTLTHFQRSYITAEYALLSIETGLPAVLTFISFIVSTINLLSKSAIPSRQARHRRAAITITIFTGVFLFCYLPIFSLCALYVCLSTIYKDELGLDSGIFSNYFMFWYSWPLAKCLLNTLNTTLDVVIYLTCMKDFRKWIRLMTGKQKESVASISSNTMSELRRFTSRQ